MVRSKSIHLNPRPDRAAQRKACLFTKHITHCNEARVLQTLLSDDLDADGGVLGTKFIPCAGNDDLSGLNRPQTVSNSSGA